ncbi:unnamed protein product [Somion occarium]|uniref:Fungal-type protein kinase domain-containing protein n=1 Tax=Somion occarium TaxID=3059160 RepID=A0ABP1CUG5_9APHY
MGLFNSLLFHNHLPEKFHDTGTCYSHFYSLALETDFDADIDIIMADAILPQDVEMHDEARDTLGPLPNIMNRAQIPPDVDVQPSARRAQSLLIRGQRTPARPSIGAIETDDDVCDPELKSFIRTEFKKHITRDYPIVDFIAHVWNTTPSQIPPGDYELSRRECRQYAAAARYSKTSKLRKLGETGPPLIGLGERAETGACYIFQELFQKTAKMVLDRWKTEDPATTDEMERSRFQGTLRFLNEKIVKGNHANIKPDFGYVTENGENMDAIAWDAFGLFGELKKADDAVNNIEPVVVDRNMLDEPYTPASLRKSRKRSRPDSPVEERPSSKQLRKNQSDSVLIKKSKPNEPGPKTPPLAKLTPQEIALLRFNQDNDDNYSDLTGNEIQAAKYLNELLSHGTRNYATGFLVENKKISLWYGDRFGIIKSRLFNFLEEPHYFLLMVTAIFRASDTDLGFCPLIRNIPRNHLSYKGATMTVPMARDHKDRDIGDVEFEVSTTEAKPIVTAYGTVGRGTIVVPISSVQQENETCSAKDRLVAKMSWQPVKRNEEGHIRTIRRTLKKSKNKDARAALAFIVKLKCSSTLAIDDPNVNLPRAFMTQLPDVPQDEMRDFRILVMKEYLPLQFVDTVDELKKVLRDALTGHHWAWTIAKTLHRDISVSNIMFHWKRGCVIGVLCDWDLAETKEYLGEDPELAVDKGHYEAVGRMLKEAQDKKDDETPYASTSVPPVAAQEPGIPQPQYSNTKATAGEGGANQDEDDESARRRKAKYRTGTGPFMALDLLASDRNPTHLYRHDLESFFWVLVWFVATHNPIAHTLGRINQWQGSDLDAVYSVKNAFIKSDAVALKVLSKRDEQYKSIWAKTIYPLQRLFHRVEAKLANLDVIRRDYVDAYMENDRTKMKKVGKAIVRDVKARNTFVSYETFMSHL